jgi:hypothetical protein
MLTLLVDLAFSDRTSNLFRKHWLNQNQTGKIVNYLAGKDSSANRSFSSN